MSVYDVTAHPILTPKALAITPAEKFASHVLLAESLLGVSGPAYTDTDLLDKARLAVAIQVNFQAEQGIDPFVYRSVSSAHSSQSAVYREHLVDPRALAMWRSTLSADDMADRFGGGLISHRRAEQPLRYGTVRRLR